MADMETFDAICLAQGWERLDGGVWFKATPVGCYDEDNELEFVVMEHCLLKRLPSGEVLYARNDVSPEAWENPHFRELCVADLRATLAREEARRG